MTNPSYDPDPTPGQTGSTSYSGETYPTGTGGYVTGDYSGTAQTGESGYESTGGGQSTTDLAKGEAANVKGTAVDAGKGVAATAKDQASTVASEAGNQAKNLVGQVLGEVRGQASTQQQRLATSIHSIAQELGSFGAQSEGGPVAGLAQQASRKTGEIAHWLENREPADLLDELRTFARRRPGMFLGLSALAGVVIGRVGRGAVAANTSLDSGSSSTGSVTSGSTYATSGQTTYTTASATGYSAVPEAGYTTGYDETASGYSTGAGTTYGGTTGSAVPGDYTTGGGYVDTDRGDLTR